MNKKVIVGVIIAIVVIVLFALLGSNSFLPSPSGGGESGGGESGSEGAQPVLGEDTFRPDNPDALSTIEGGTREKIKEEIATPGLEATNVPQDVAVPVNVSTISGPSGSVALRTFEIRAEGGKFSPSTIVVDEGDVITVRLIAVDASSSITFPDFGAYVSVEAGQTGQTQFQTSNYGQYEFLGPNDMKGVLIVNEKQ